MYYKKTTSHIRIGLTIGFILWGYLCVVGDTAFRNPRRKEFYTVPDSQIVWGKPANFQVGNPFNMVSAALEAGIRSSNKVITLSGNPPRLAHPVSIYLKNAKGRAIWTIPISTNGGVPSHMLTNGEFLSWIFLPPEAERFAATMTDSKGILIQKTPNGIALTVPKLEGKKWNHWDRDKRQPIGLLPYEDVEAYTFDPTRYFAIPIPGVYKLTFVQHLYIINTNNLLEAISLPAVIADVKVE